MKEKTLANLSITEENHKAQIKKDLIRSDKNIPFLLHPKIQQMMENVLLIWASRHLVCGYVQGINDLLVPFISVYLSEYTCLLFFIFTFIIKIMKEN